MIDTPIDHGTIQVRLSYNVVYDSFDIYAVVTNAKGQTTHVAKPLVMVPVAEFAESVREPTMRIPGVNFELAIEYLLKELERAGVRPSRHTGTESELEATKRHLEDARTNQSLLQAAIIRQLDK